MCHTSKTQTSTLRQALLSAAMLTSPFLMVGCGGGGGDSTPVQTPAPSQPASFTPPVQAPVSTPVALTPTQIAPISSFETSEYFNGVGLDLIGASTAYAYGATGKGITVAVIDTDVLNNHPELRGQIHAASMDLFADDRAQDDFDHTGHGSAIAAIIAGNKDGEGIHGVAYESEILAIRADRAGSCVYQGIAGPCGFRDDHVAQGIDYAIAQGVQIINLSVGGEITADQTLEDAIKRAVDAGILVVIAAGNDAQAAHTDGYGYDHAASGTSPNEPAYLAGLADSLGLVVAVGAIDAEGRISDFSNRAGADSRTFYLLAPGEGVISAGPDDNIVQPNADGNDTDNEGDYYRIDGSSFAAPYVAGSLALLLQAFPNLDGATALQILIDTADDYIDPDIDPVTGEVAGIGVDNVGGAGIVNLANAFTPQGVVSAKINGKTIPIAALTAPAQGAFGDWASHSAAFEGQAMTDVYARAFTLPTSGLNTNAKPAIADFEAQHDWFNAHSQSLIMGESQINFSTTQRAQMPWEYVPVEDDIMLSAKFSLGAATMELGKGGAMTKLAPTPSLSGNYHSAIAPSGSWTRFTTQYGAYDVQSFAAQTETSDLVGTAIGQDFGKLKWRTAFARKAEEGTALGSQIQSRLGAGKDRSTHYILGFEAQHAFGNGWQVSGGAEFGTLTLDGLDAHGVTTSQASIGLSKTMGKWGRFRAVIAQPTRVEAGTLTFSAATGMDNTGTLITNIVRAGLSPSGREINVEAGWDFNLGGKWQGSLSALQIKTPNHVKNAPKGHAAHLQLKRAW